MKKLLLLLVCMIATIAVNAQDIIVKKDGTTIQAKVLRVTVDEVKYRAYSNLNGPTLTIRISELLAINYEDGEKETFNTSASPSTNNTSIVTHETATTFSNDQELLRLYNQERTKAKHSIKTKTGKKIRIYGLIGGGAICATGAIMFAVNGAGGSSDRSDNFVTTGGLAGTFVGGGVAICTASLLVARHIDKMAEKSVQTTTLFENNFNLRNGNSIALGIDAIKDNLNYSQTVGLGLRYNF